MQPACSRPTSGYSAVQAQNQKHSRWQHVPETSAMNWTWTAWQHGDKGMGYGETAASIARNKALQCSRHAVRITNGLAVSYADRWLAGQERKFNTWS
jgi:hypothetical protein